MLNAQTGEAVTKVTDITRTDSLLNIKAGGSERLAQGVQKQIDNEGATTYHIGLTAYYGAQTASGESTDVLLSFDLLGFDDADSSVTIKDITHEYLTTVAIHLLVADVTLCSVIIALWYIIEHPKHIGNVKELLIVSDKTYFTG